MVFGFGKKKMSLLLVDDNQQIADGLKKYFSHNSMPTEVCYSAAALKEKLSGPAPRAVVIDVDLGDGNGIEMIPELKHAWPDVAVIVLTGMGYDDALMEQAQANHAQAYVSKLVPPEQLLANILGVLEHPEHHVK